MIIKHDGTLEEQQARGGSFDITGTAAVIDKQFWGFNASDGAVLEAIKGVAVGSSLSTLAAIRTVEVDISGVFLTAVTDPLFANSLYVVDGYIITSIKLTSGSLHPYKTIRQITA